MHWYKEGYENVTDYQTMSVNCKIKKRKTINCQYDVTVKGMEAMELTVNSLIEVVVNLYKQGFDVYTVDIDKAKIKADNIL